MTHIVKHSKTVFVDTDTLTNGSSKARVLFPPMFQTCCDDRMRLTLLQLVVPKRFYNINATNKIFYVRDDSADLYIEVVIPEGTYSTFALLASAIQTGLRTADSASIRLNDATCEYDADTRKFTIKMPSALTDTFLVCWQSRGSRPVGVSPTGFFQQSHIILGARPSRGDLPVEAYSSTGDGGRQTIGTSSFYPASLSSLDSLYLRCNLMGGHFQSIGHERFIPNNPNQVIESQIWARIPIDDPTSLNPVIFHDSGSDMFTIEPSQRNLDTLELFLTDEWGRSLAEVSPGQVADGMLNFTATIRWDVMTPAKTLAHERLRTENLATNINHVVAP